MYYVYPSTGHYPHQHQYVIPFYPVLVRDNGQYKKITDTLLEAIKGEASAVQFYQQLMNAAPNEKAREDVQHALEDERKHLKQFTDLYVMLTGKRPVYKTKAVSFNTFKEGLNIARKDELEAYEDYRDAYLATQDQVIRDVFFLAMTDEIEHALRFSFLLSELR
ncbi:rubrerythrin [Anoxybacillus vitaminiphilus]|uniref:Rubrerythrin n=1 Tax=Paranoxybacillus vitaminiphilus TaxID=581036 RepID=A0A327YQ75_9BACL|nr:ferritin-like domain-containing protein [Anoxybacillus vitaminiphilus]RAK23123.1 rubrerythrin [Anoxybacillus vitaminiphilus]